MSAISYAAANVLRLLPRAAISRAMGHLADVRWTPLLGRAVVGAYTRAYDVELGEAAQTSDWASFDAFFTRSLRAGARSVDMGDGAIVSPADGRLESTGPVEDDATFTVKGRPYSVEELVGSADEARRYRGGQGGVIYLSPRDYHRVHAPVAGEIRSIRSLPGDFLPVNSVGVEHFPNLFARNRRVAIAIDTPPESGLGRVTVVMVAAMIVGRITVSGIDARDVPLGSHALQPGLRLERGDEIAVFHLGSTAVMFVEPCANAAWVSRNDARVRYGQRLLAVQGKPGARG